MRTPLPRPTETGRPRARRAGALLAAAVALAACSREAAGGKATPTPAVTGPRVTLPAGFLVRVELARTDAERAQGLMYRESMREGDGMLFLFDDLAIRPFWMKNCHFPLDMIYTLKDGTVVDVLENVPPCAADPCPSFPPAAKADTVLEVNAGVARKYGVKTGAKLVYRDVPGR